MRKRIVPVIALAVSVSAIVTYPQAEELVAKMRDSTKFVMESQASGCNFNSQMNTPLYQRCSVPSITNEAWGHILRNGFDQGFANSQQLREKFSFTVYTKQEIDKTVIDLREEISALRAHLDHNSQMFIDTKFEILKTIDKLPTSLPTEPGFYQQMRERLKASIGAELDKAKQGVTAPVQ